QIRKALLIRSSIVGDGVERVGLIESDFLVINETVLTQRVLIEFKFIEDGSGVTRFVAFVRNPLSDILARRRWRTGYHVEENKYLPEGVELVESISKPIEVSKKDQGLRAFKEKIGWDDMTSSKRRVASTKKLIMVE